MNYCEPVYAINRLINKLFKWVYTLTEKPPLQTSKICAKILLHLWVKISKLLLFSFLRFKLCLKDAFYQFDFDV